MSVFFTADTHFGHKNVIAFCNRPYADVNEMDEDLILKWNETVGVEDVIYHLGDFAFMDKIRTAATIQRLNGRKVLVMGNHDIRSRAFYLESGFAFVYKLKYGESQPYWTENEEVGFRMAHFPFKDAMGEYDDRDYLTERAPTRGEYDVPLVHGHVHAAWKVKPGLVNVGVDVWDLKPVSLEKVIEYVKFADCANV